MFTVFIATLSLFIGALAAARYLHNDLLHHVMRAPIPEFFDITPFGRIINRMSHDIDTIDNDFPATLRAWASCIFTVFSNTTKRSTFSRNFSAEKHLSNGCQISETSVFTKRDTLESFIFFSIQILNKKNLKSIGWFFF